jgi:DNA-directed RNA polymerase specialized sigma24 family protein
MPNMAGNLGSNRQTYSFIDEYLDSLDNKTIAEKFGISIKTVSSRRRRFKQSNSA